MSKRFPRLFSFIVLSSLTFTAFSNAYADYSAGTVFQLDKGRIKELQISIRGDTDRALNGTADQAYRIVFSWTDSNGSLIEYGQVNPCATFPAVACNSTLGGSCTAIPITDLALKNGLDHCKALKNSLDSAYAGGQTLEITLGYSHTSSTGISALRVVGNSN